MERMRELIRLLNEASMVYYQQDREIMSDYEYDKLYDELERLEKETGIVLSDSPTQNVGYTVLSNLEKVRHEYKMLSLDKTKEPERLVSFLGSAEGVLSYKMDGLTIVLTYNAGQLIRAVTRGNGEVGENITHNARVFKNIPLSVNYNGELIVRGEAVISFKDFVKINERLESEAEYKNPRNLCSGTVRQLNNEIAAKRNVVFFAFSMSADGVDFKDLKSNQLEWLKALGFQTVKYKLVDSDSIVESVYEFEKEIPNNDFATDGLVLTFNSLTYSAGLGSTAKFPRDSIAFKWADEKSETVLKDVEWNTSRTGLINPIAVFEPVELEGTTVNRAALHNLSIFEKLQMGIGDRITVYKANMIIPQIEDNLTRSATLKPPENCPVCGEKTVEININDGKVLKCVNPNCHAQLVRSIAHFASIDAMNIEGLSEATAEKLVEKGFVDNYTDIYSLQQYREEIINMEGFGEKSYNNLMNAIEKSKNVEMENFINALGINNVGLISARMLAKECRYDINAVINAKAEDIEKIHGFGKIIAASIERYFSNEKNRSYIEKMKSILVFPTHSIESQGILDGFTFVITGSLEHYKNRNELQERIERLGGTVAKTVSGKTSFLINNDVNSNSTKNKKAKELNVNIISEAEFINRFDNELK